MKRLFSQTTNHWTGHIGPDFSHSFLSLPGISSFDLILFENENSARKLISEKHFGYSRIGFLV